MPVEGRRQARIEVPEGAHRDPQRVEFAVDVFGRHTQALPCGGADAADALANDLGDLPLALEQAAAYIDAHQLPLASYLQRLQDKTTAILGRTALGADPQRAVARVFVLTSSPYSANTQRQSTSSAPQAFS